jgi:hypothetical protein
MRLFFQRPERTNFEALGYETSLQCRDDQERARNICGLHLHAYKDEQQPEIARLESEIKEHRGHEGAFHAHLYDRACPVSDAAMLTHSRKVWIVCILCLFAAIACLGGNIATFYLYGFGALATFGLGVVATAVPLIVGHIAYQRIVERHKYLQLALIGIAVALCFLGLYKLGDARRTMAQKAAATPAAAEFVERSAADAPVAEQGQDEAQTEANIREAVGSAMLLIMFAADLMLGFFAGLVINLRTDEDYAAWRELSNIKRRIDQFKQMIAERLSAIEIAKKQCAAGILRAQAAMGKRRPPYHGVLSALIFFVLVGAATVRAQTVDHYEGILIDTSGSIAQGDANLFEEYLVSIKKLLLTEPANTRVWVSGIAVDSFGGQATVLKGWTPDTHGVFTSDLTRARRELASAFEKKSADLSPAAAGTDILGGLSRFKALFESETPSGASREPSKTIWILSDMMNETRSFPMPALLTNGPEKMLERAKAKGLLMPLKGYRIHVYGASLNGLTPQAWLVLKSFWNLYFKAAGAELVSYSAECAVGR